VNESARMKGENELSSMHVQDLANSLLATAEALVKYLASQGVTTIPERRYEAHWMEPVPEDDTRSEGKTALYTEPDPGHILWTCHEQLDGVPSVAQLGTVLKDFADKHGGFPASGWIGSSMDIARRVIDVYFTKCRRLAVDEAIARQVISEYCVDLSAPTITARSVFQVENFSAACPFKLAEEIEFRPISQDDIREQARTQLVPPPYHWPWLDTRDWICEVNKKGPRDTYEAVNWNNEGRRYIATTLALISSGAARLVLLHSRHASPFLSVVTKSGGEATRTGPGGKPLQLDRQAVQDAQKLYPKVVSVLSGTGPKYLRFALERFIAAAQRREPEDQLVDYVLGLESLLAPDTDRLETTIRFRLRGASLLPSSSFGGPEERINLLNGLYKVRSEVVHGGGANKHKVADCIPKAEDALRHVLRWFMDDRRWKCDPRAIVKKLDEMMVEGGSKWAEPCPRH